MICLPIENTINLINAVKRLTEYKLMKMGLKARKYELTDLILFNQISGVIKSNQDHIPKYSKLTPNQIFEL